MENILDLNQLIINSLRAMENSGMKPARLYINTNNYNAILQDTWADESHYAGLEVIHDYHLPLNDFTILSEDEIKYSELLAPHLQGKFESVEVAEDILQKKIAVKVKHKGVTVSIGIPFNDMAFNKEKRLKNFGKLLTEDLAESVRLEREKWPYLKLDHPED